MNKELEAKKLGELITIFKELIESEQEVLELIENRIDGFEEHVAKLKAKKMMLEAEIDAERMGHPSDK